MIKITGDVIKFVCDHCGGTKGFLHNVDGICWMYCMGCAQREKIDGGID
jgi:hypothetical protein